MERKEIGQQLHKALTQSTPSLDKIQPLVESWRGALSVAGVNGNLPLHDACAYEAPLEVVQYLVKAHPKSLKVTDNYGYLPLHHACIGGAPLEVVSYLVEARPQTLLVTDNEGNLPIYHACEGRAPPEVVLYLVQEYPESLQVPENNGDLPLHHVCKHGASLEVISYLVEEYPESLQVTGNNGNLPLHHACTFGAPLEVVRYLVEEYPRSLHVADINGQLPLHHACNHGAPLELVRYLVQQYPESLQVIGINGKTPIALAKNQEVVAWMRSAMAISGIAFEPLSSSQPSLQPTNLPFSPDKNTRIYQNDIHHHVSLQQPSLRPVDSSSFDQRTPGQTPSLSNKRKAIKQQLLVALRELPPSLGNIQTLVEAWRGALSVADINGNLPLHLACYHGAPLYVVRYLVQEYPESLQVTNKDGGLAVHYACNCNRGSPLEIVRYVVQENPKSLQVTDINGQLPLHHACNHGAPLELVRYLVQQYPESLQVIGINGKTPIDLAKNQEVVAWMRSAMANSGIAFEALSSSQPSVQPTNLPFSPDKKSKKTRIYQNDIHPPVSSQEPSLRPADASSFDQTRPVQTPSLTASVSVTAALPSDDNTKITQSHMNPTKDTEGADFVADSERFSEEASTEDRSEEGAGDFKRMLEEMSR
jgi:ankyrin repeat protein